MARGLYAEIDVAALRHNLNVTQSLAKKSKIIAMIKANGYGHGLVHVARALSKADAFGVACIEEALELRQHHIQQRIILMEGFFDASELKEILYWQLEPVLHNMAQIAMLKKNLNAQLKVWLKIDTGMHRLGFNANELAQALTLLQAHTCVTIVGIMTHFSCANNPASRKTTQQITSFQRILAQHSLAHLPQSLCNSAALMRYPEAHADFVRPGVMLYGVSPFWGRTGVMEGLRPVMTLKTRLIARHNLHAGEQVGYNSSYTCPRDMPIGIIAIGYGDGFPWRVSPTTCVLLHGQRVPIIGRVAMDMISIDLSLVPQAQPYDQVIIWGPGLPVEHVADTLDTIPWELLTSLSSRVPVRLKEPVQIAATYSKLSL